MKTVRSILIAIAVLFVLGFGVPLAFHRVTCEVFTLGVCAISPYPQVVDFLSIHRVAWLASAIAYAVAVILVFRGRLITSFAVFKRRSNNEHG